MQIKKLLKSLIPSPIYWLPRYHLFLKRLNYKNNDLILDAGCGEGIVTIYLAKKKLEIVGIDDSFEQVKQAQLSYNKNIFSLSDINHLPFKKDTFDLIFSLDVLEYVKDIEKVFVEFHRLLKPKGKLIISVTRDYTCSAKLFILQKILRKITPHFLYTHDLPKNRSWLDFTSKEMAEKLGHSNTYSLSEIIKKSRGLFELSFYKYFIKIAMTLATDIVYGIKGFYYLRFLLFFVATRIDYYFFKKMPGYFILLELMKI